MKLEYDDAAHEELKKKISEVFGYISVFDMNEQAVEEIKRQLQNVVVVAAWEAV